MKKQKPKLLLDSGAPTLYAQKIQSYKAKKGRRMGSQIEERKLDDFNFIKTTEYEQLFNNYIKFITENKTKLEGYINFDVINNAEETYKNQLIMEKNGLNPIPVFHFGSDEKWLKKYLSRGYDYIALGGMVPLSSSVLIPALDKLWKKYFISDNGSIKIKIHGFAITSHLLMSRYPWYSVDSTTWKKQAAFGIVHLPVITVDGRLDWNRQSRVCFSSLSAKSKRYQLHEVNYYNPNFSEYERKVIMDFLIGLGQKYNVDVRLGHSEFKNVQGDYELKEKERWYKKPKDGKGIIETIYESGLCNSSYLRAEMNVLYFSELINKLHDKEKIIIYFACNDRKDIKMLEHHNVPTLLSCYFSQNRKYVESLGKKKKYKKI